MSRSQEDSMDRDNAKALAPPLGLIVKLGSIAVHAKEMTSPDGHEFDAIALKALLNDPDVRNWLTAMDRMAMIPKMRKP